MDLWGIPLEATWIFLLIVRLGVIHTPVQLKMPHRPPNLIQGPLAYISATNFILNLNFFFLPQFPILL